MGAIDLNARASADFEAKLAETRALLQRAAFALLTVFAAPFETIDEAYHHLDPAADCEIIATAAVDAQKRAIFKLRPPSSSVPATSSRLQATWQPRVPRCTSEMKSTRRQSGEPCTQGSGKLSAVGG